VIEDGVSGRLVPPRDPPAFAGTLLELLEDRETRARLVRGGSESVRRFDAGATVAETERVYRDALQERGIRGVR
jgi:glycosyltransferase involved in cell wall biosynthesis